MSWSFWGGNATSRRVRRVEVKYVITGAGGLLGDTLSKVMAYRDLEFVALPKSELDVTNLYAVEQRLQRENPDIIFHCAAFTDVDKAESQRTSAFAVNKYGACIIAEISRKLGSRMVSYSTDYVFDGTKRIPYTPSDEPVPISVYGESKHAGEIELLSSGVDLLLIRTSWLYGATGRNFVNTVIKEAGDGKTLRLIDDQTGSPTWAINVAEISLDLVDKDASGTYHVSDSGEASWYELGREILSICGIETALEPISTEAWHAPAARPRYSVLDSSKAEFLLGRSMTNWRNSLNKFLGEVLE